MPQALVLLGFLAATVILRLAASMEVRDIVVLLVASGGVGVAVLIATSVRHGGERRLLQRILSAFLNSGPAN